MRYAKSMETSNFIQTTIPHNLKDPHSKALEPDCLSPFAYDYNTSLTLQDNGFLMFSEDLSQRITDLSHRGIFLDRIQNKRDQILLAHRFLF